MPNAEQQTPLPMVLRVQRRRWGWFVIPATLSPFAPGLAFVFPQPRSLALYVVAISVTVVLCFGANALARRARERVIHRARMCDWMCCQFCAYDLSGRINEDHCPECGGPFDPELTARLWQNAEAGLRVRWWSANLGAGDSDPTNQR